MLPVPFRSQHDLRRHDRVAGELWAPRTCAIACMTMVLRYYGYPVEVADVLAAARQKTHFDPRRGWLHSGLVDLLQFYGLAAYRRNWALMDGNELRYLAGRPSTAATQAEVEQVKQQMRAEGFATMRHLLRRDTPVIASVLRPWGNRTSMGHQVVLLAATSSKITYHEPAEEDGAGRTVPSALFLTSWKGLAIVAGTRSVDGASRPAGTDQPQ
jgi:hypothetical protein